ncbi:HVA22-like protein a [Canna indica]|uniref:HVA22-like protein n=1 Tax=Canna indica TaxID=4628 RepID=A0AAQ3Q9I7_9LILI|nr:HVA22-like protein a [Canna indica]
MGSGAFLRVLARNFDVFAGPVVTLVYPLYASVKAVETKSPVDDQQWLTYWVLHSLLTLFELTFATILEWLPFWSYAKLFFNCWLVLPYFNGAAYVYEHFVRPLVMNQQTVNIWYIPKKGIFSKPDDVLSAAEKFIEENGLEAFEKLVNKAKNVPKSTKSSKCVTFDVDETKKNSKSWKNFRRMKFGKSDTETRSKASNSDRHVTFDDIKGERQSTSSTNKVDPEKESKPSASARHVASDETDTERESRSWINSNFMIFDDDNRYWNDSFRSTNVVC